MLKLPLKRAKECFPASVELSPVRLIGGFVCVDSHLGCVGCHFCLNRRYPAARELLDRKVHREWAEAGLPPEALAELVARLPAVARGGVPVRFGHLSDLCFELAGARALLARLPPAHPVLLLTRFPPAAELSSLLLAHPNALLHLSITPPVPGALASEVAPETALAAGAALPPARLFVMFGPLVAGSEAAVLRLLPAIPAGAAVGFKPLAAEGVPFPIGVSPLGAAAVAALSARARALGLDVPPMAGCRLRSSLRLPFFRHRELVGATPGSCDGCGNRAVCAAVPPPPDEALVEEAAVLGLTVEAIRRESRALLLEVGAPVARADEAYLSERLRFPVFLSGVGRGEEFRVVELREEVLARWERTGFYPVRELSAVVARMVALAGLTPPAAAAVR